MKENKKVFTEEQLLEIKNIVNSNHRTDWLCIIAFIVLMGFFCFGLYIMIDLQRNYNEVDERIEDLSFCQSIYESDHVVLDKCKDYFVILGENGNVR